MKDRKTKPFSCWLEGNVSTELKPRSSSQELRKSNMCYGAIRAFPLVGRHLEHDERVSLFTTLKTCKKLQGITQSFILLYYFSHPAVGTCALRCGAWEALKEASMFPFHKLFSTGRLVEIQQRHQDSAKPDLRPKVSEETCAVYRGKAPTSVLTEADHTTYL